MDWRHGTRRRSAGWVLAAAVPLAAACAGDESGGVLGPGASGDLSCSIPTSEIFNGGPGKDGIPALTNPPTVRPGDPGTGYLRDDDRVIGVIAEDEVIAIPLNIMWWHEIVNVDLGGRTLAVTHCPLTGSSLAFDREPLGGVELGVSGLLFRNNLIMYDRADEESLWPQMARGARCGVRNGQALSMYPIVEATWEGWRTLHPRTRVVSQATGFSRDYTEYPYGAYARIDNGELLFPLPDPGVDRRRPPKERVLGVPGGDGGMAFPFGELARLGAFGVARLGDAVILWDGIAQAAMAYRPELDGEPVTLVVQDLRIVDEETASVWSVAGIATEGPLAGARLEPVPEAYVAYWFAWAVFQPETAIWSAP